MKKDPGLDRKSLAARIDTEYGLQVAQLEFLPKGEVGYCYLMDSDAGLRYLVKVLPSNRLGLKSAERLDFCLPLTWNLSHGEHFRNLPCPIQTQNGALKTEFQGMPMVLYNFIEGRTIAQALKEVTAGRALSSSLRMSGFFPPIALDMMEVGETTGAMSTMLEALAEFFEEDVNIDLATLVALVDPIMIASIAIVVAFVLVAFYLPLFSMAAQVH